MKKNYVRLLAMLVCVVMVFAMVPAKANAVQLQGKKMPQMETITYDEDWQAHFITECADLIQVANAAINDPYNYYVCYFDQDATFVISQNVTIPNNMDFSCWGDLVIAPNVTVTVNGGNMSGNTITVNGTLNVQEYGYTHTGSALINNGTVNLGGTLSIMEYTTVSGNPINYLEDGRLNVNCYFENSAQLQKIADNAAAHEDRKYYAGATSETIYLASPIELPGNLNLQFYLPNSQISGATITVHGYMNVEGNGNIVIKNNLVLNGPSSIYTWEDENGQIGSVTFEGTVTNNEYMDIYGKVNFKNTVVNNYRMDVWYEYGATMTFANANLYSDGDNGIIWVNSSNASFPNNAIAGLNVNDFQTIDYWTDWSIPYWALMDYANSTPVPPVHEHSVVVDAAVAPTCLTYGSTEGAHCATCGEVLVKQETLAPLGHYYGLNENGDSDCWNPECLTCGALRVINPNHLTASMYRMYNPNSGEHFYTGSLEERQVLEAAGWKYEGVGFTICANTGDPVYRLFNPANGEHLYTMNELEVEQLMVAGWNMEGIAFNSCPTKEVPQYRLFNPNAIIGAYHFTASAEERDMLLAAGWIDQGIGFYSCWQ